MQQEGLYEQLINKLVASKLKDLDRNAFHVGERSIDKEEACELLTRYLSDVIRLALKLVEGPDSVQKQIELSNKLVLLLQSELEKGDFGDDIVAEEGRLLTAIFSKVDPRFSDFDRHLREITPYTRLSQSELFTGNNAGISLESEIRKEILSSNQICFLVSFIKWTGIRIFEKELNEFSENGGKLRIITTSYMGATDLKAVEYLSKLRNAEVKISYNTDNERLHAKAYLFFRVTGFHTGYIGSSNISRSALTNGLEWNLKVTTKEIAHIIDKFQKTFETYWQDKEFERFENSQHSEKLRIALRREKVTDVVGFNTYFDVKPYSYQEEILEKLQAERALHNRYRNLIVAATGTGKTIISAFDFKAFRTSNPSARLLFIAHRKEILQQALAAFQGILRDNNFGELWVDGIEPEKFDCVFASIQTLNTRLSSAKLSQAFYDFIIIDEVHHITAATYRPIINYFTPVILLGLTATPERTDDEDILKDFSGTIAAEIRLPEALNRKLLCPFQYFGLTDSIDLSSVEWKNGKYEKGALSRIYTQNNKRVGEILDNMGKYLRDIHDVRGLGFCITQDHAKFMAERFLQAGLKADYLTSTRSDERDILRKKFQTKEINYLFVVDIFNEGIDIPEIDTVLFLRPTESLTVFLQQLGRGLRLSEGKECLTVLDFVGNSRPEYDFEGKFRALVGKTNTSTIKEIEDEFPHLPLGCSIVLEKKARQVIIENIRQATTLNKNQLIGRIRNFKYQTNLPLTLRHFSDFHHIPIQIIYKKGSWKRLCALANQIEEFSSVNEIEIWRAIRRKWLSCYSTSYFEFVLSLAKLNFDFNIDTFSEEQKSMLLMLHYDVWQEQGGFESLEKSIRAIGRNHVLTSEIVEFLEMQIDKIDFIERPVRLPYLQPLQLHGRYTRDQILSAFGFSTFNKKRDIQEGIAYSEEKNTELLFVTLNKSELDYSPTTLYKDFAISQTIFEWQTQNSARPERGKGKEYIIHKETGRKILLFVRERNDDEFGNTMGFVFLGEVNFIDHYGSKPMSIKWELNEPMPAYIWKESAKMAIG